MTQYINKDTLVAEIKRRKELVSDPILSCNDLMIGERNAFFNLLSFINTLEVKEVNLEEEITDYINRHYHIRFDETLERGNDPLTTMDFEEIAKYFFELGLKAQKGE